MSARGDYPCLASWAEEAGEWGALTAEESNAALAEIDSLRDSVVYWRNLYLRFLVAPSAPASGSASEPCLWCQASDHESSDAWLWQNRPLTAEEQMAQAHAHDLAYLRTLQGGQDDPVLRSLLNDKPFNERSCESRAEFETALAAAVDAEERDALKHQGWIGGTP